MYEHFEITNVCTPAENCLGNRYYLRDRGAADIMKPLKQAKDVKDGVEWNKLTETKRLANW